jgi:hypothetical protein
MAARSSISAARRGAAPIRRSRSSSARLVAVVRVSPVRSASARQPFDFGGFDAQSHLGSRVPDFLFSMHGSLARSARYREVAALRAPAFLAQAA